MIETMSGWSPAAPRPFSPAAAGAAAASGASGASAMGSWRFGPEVRHVEAPASEKVNQLRRSFTSLQAEMQLSFQRQDGEVASEPFGAFLPNSGREGVLAPVAGGSMALGSSSSLASTVPGGAADVSPSNAKSETGELDVWLKEKAQKIKDHVTEMANAQRRAEDVGRSLQDHLDQLAELRRMLRQAQADLAEELAKAQELERKRDALRQEQADLQSQIVLREQEFQELRSNRDDVDRQLSRALAEQGLQKNNLEVSKRRFDEMEEKGRETTKRLEMAREELHGLRAEDGESPVRSTVEDAKAILAQKTAKLNQQTLQVEKLEKELQDNREQLEKQSLRMAEVHAEATEFEMKSKCLDERKLQLQQDLEDKRLLVQQSLAEKDEQQRRLAEARESCARDLAVLKDEEQRVAEARTRYAQTADELERDVAAKQHELQTAKSHAEEIQKVCSELEKTRSSRRSLLQDRTAALQAAQARAQDLEEELAGTEAELATAATELQRLEKEEVERATEIEDARQKLSEVQMEIETMQARAQTSRVDDLEATSRALAESLQKAGQERTAAREKQDALKVELHESESDLKKAEAEVASLTGELEKAQSEAESLTEQVNNLLQSSSGDKSKAETLQKSVEANNKELDATRGLLVTRQLEVEALHQVLDNENQSHRQELEALEAAAEASTQSSQELAQQLRELERRRDEAADALAAAESHKLAVEQEIQKVIAETEKVTKETYTSLSLLKAQTPQTYAQGAEQKPDDPEAVKLRQLKQQVEAEAQRVANLRSDLAAREVEVERQASIAAALAPAGGVSELEGSLQQMNMELVRAQESARKSRRQEEDLRNDLAKLKERTAATRDKLLYQEDHLKLQGETLAKLESQKAKSEGDVETLTLGLHKLDQENQYLQEAIKHLMQQVEAKHGGSLDGWAGESCEAQVAREVARYVAEIEQWKRQTEQVRRQKTGEVTRQYQEHEVTVQTLNQRIDKLQKEIIQCDRCAKSWEEEKSRRTNSAPTSPTVLPGLVIFQRPLPSHHERRKALLIGVNYSNSHAPLKGCINDVWNMQCLLRYTLRYTPEQLQLLVDGADGRSRPDRAPTKANILAGLQWLIEDVRPGDHLLLVFSGYGAQHPRTPGSNKCESYLVPSDFAADLPSDFFEVVASACKSPAQPNVIDQTAKMAAGAAPGGPEEIERQAAAAQKALGNSKASYRLISMLEVHDFLSQLPQRCRVSLLLDACYTILPGAGPESNSPATFRKVDRGRVEYDKLRNFMSRPRFLELPPLPVQHTPPHLPRSNSFLPCTLHCFSGCRLKEWCAEFPIEGSVQGAFSWAFLKALAQGHFHIGVYQFQQLVSNILLNLKGYFRHIDQQPVLQLSAAASPQDVVLWT